MMKPGERSVSEPTQAPFWGDGRAWTSSFAGCTFVAIETRSRSTCSPAPKPLLTGSPARRDHLVPNKLRC